MKSLFINANASVKETLSDSNSQTASLLKPISAVLTTSEGETTIIDDSALISDSGPMGTIADVEYLVPADIKIETYLVKKGDSLGKIAEMFGVSVNTIVWANDIGSNQIIREGQNFIILPVSGVRHKIKSGDTILGLAKLYGGDVQDILRYNDINADDKLAIGDIVIIPDGEIKSSSVKSTTPTVSRIAKGLPNYDSYYIKPAVSVRRTQGLHGSNGVDLAPLSKTSGTEPILASAAGVVIASKSSSGWNGGYGKFIVISHLNGTQTVYGHAHTILVNEGDRVEQGQIICFIGNTGKSTGPHLHFEVRGAHNPF